MLRFYGIPYKDKVGIQVSEREKQKPTKGHRQAELESQTWPEFN